jgi:hypothetical protein
MVVIYIALWTWTYVRSTQIASSCRYVRKGFGNELVRNSKTVARVVASEKFRWSLRNARLRRAKKQAFCVYYTRFGVCKRGDGKCLYIHDPEKVAVCTKFLRGSCSDPACRLTHKVQIILVKLFTLFEEYVASEDDDHKL